MPLSYKVCSAHVRADIKHDDTLELGESDVKPVTTQFQAEVQILASLGDHFFAANQTVPHLVLHTTPRMMLVSMQQITNN